MTTIFICVCAVVFYCFVALGLFVSAWFFAGAIAVLNVAWFVLARYDSGR